MTIAHDTTDDPDLIDVLRTAIAAGVGKIRTSIPAEVVSYDATRQTITARVVVRSRYVDPSARDGRGEVVTYLPPLVSGVPVAFPSGGGYAITWPLEVGDPVVLVVADRSIAEWKETAQGDNTPNDPRRFDLTDAIAIPGVRAPVDPLTGVADGMVITLPAAKSVLVGSLSAAYAVARGDLVASVLGTLKTWLDTHVHTSAAAGSPTTPPVAASPSPASTASTRLKTDG